MKFKAAITDNAPEKLIRRLDDMATASLLMQRVVVECLHVAAADLGPATHYVQATDRLIALSQDVGVVVGLTMVSKQRTRSDQDFEDALLAIESVYAEIVASEMPRGRRAQLFVAIAIDGDVEAPLHMRGRRTNLIETEPKWIEGLCTEV
jgi:hypothetical protein